MPFDLSQVMFLTTANDASTIPGPLYDRMDVIELPSYTSEEKYQIAVRHLIPKQLAKNGLTKKQLRITPAGVRDLIENYTREAGVRTLERRIADLCRKSRQKCGGKSRRGHVPDGFAQKHGRTVGAAPV